MKKLMIAAAIVCAAAFAQAGTVVWGNRYALDDYNKPEDAGYYNGTAYLISGSAADFFALATTEGSSWADALAAAAVITSATLTDGETFSNPSKGSINGDGRLEIEGYSGLVNAFVTAVDANGNFYISEELEKSVPGTGGETFYFEHGGSYEAGTNPVALTAGWQEGGAWYTAAAVPEPTSGLLLLLGVAGLALRRRRA